MPAPVLIGPEFLLGSEALNQEFPDIAIRPDGSIVAVWSTGDIAWSVLDPTGLLRSGPELVNTLTPGLQSRPAVALLSGGGMVVAYVDENPASDDNSSGAVRMMVTGPDSGAGPTRLAEDALVNTTTADRQADVVLSPLANGNFVAVWLDTSANLLGPAGNAGDIRGQIFNPAGQKIGSEFIVNTIRGNSQIQPTVTTLANGNFVVAWTDMSALTTGGTFDVRAQLYLPGGSPLGPEMVVNTNLAHYQQLPSVAALEGGGFVIVWSHRESLSSSNVPWEIYGQRFAANGAKLGDEFLVNDQTAATQYGAKVTGLPGGGFAVVWEQEGGGFAGDNLGVGLRARTFDAAGVPTGLGAQVNTSISGSQVEPTLNLMPDGRLLVTWADYGVGPSVVRGQFLDVGLGRLVPATANGDFLYGSTAGEVIDGLAGNDSILGHDGNDTLLGSDGNDTVDGGAGNDMVGGGGGNDLINGGEGTNTLFGGYGDDTLYGGTGVDEIYGGPGRNTLFGNDGADYLQAGNEGDNLGGGAGADTLRGGSGGDTLYGGDGNDNIGGGAGNDVIHGISGANVIWAGLGNDTVLGGSGSDTIYGGAGRNQIFGNEGDDVINTSAGGDFAAGGAGNDTVLGAGGDDSIYAGFGDDFIGGGAGNDLIVCGAGNNRVYGGIGRDTLVAGDNRDVMTGGPGADVFVFLGAAQIGIGAGRDVITDFTSGVDDIDLRALATSFNGSAGLVGGGAKSFFYFAASGLLIGDQNGDAVADWVIELSSKPAVAAGDFLL